MAEITQPFPSHMLFENAKEHRELWIYNQGIVDRDQIKSIFFTILARDQEIKYVNPIAMSHPQDYAYEGAGV